MTGTADMFDAMRDAHTSIAEASYPDFISFQQSTMTTSDVGGHVLGSVPLTRTPAKIPCRYKFANAWQRTLAEKQIVGAAYMFRIPAKYKDQLIDVKGNYDVLLYARPSGGEGARTLHIRWIGRTHGTYIEVLASVEE